MGAFQAIAGNDGVAEAVSKALGLGYRHFHTAFQYGTEEHIGQAIRESAFPREGIFTTSKLYKRSKLLIQEIPESTVSVTDGIPGTSQQT